MLSMHLVRFSPEIHQKRALKVNFFPPVCKSPTQIGFDGARKLETKNLMLGPLSGPKEQVMGISKKKE
jgi:hypothetical protein